MQRPHFIRLAVALAAAAAVLLAWARPVAAGTYDVYACDAAGGVNHAWTPAVSHGALTAYASCPSNGNSQRGLVARNLNSHARVPRGARAALEFAAPSGAAVTAVTASYKAYRAGGYGRWAIGFWAGSRLLTGCSAATSGCSSFTYPNTDAIAVRHASTVALGATCQDSRGCMTGSDGEELVAQMHAYYTRVTVADWSSPAIAPTAGALLGGGWHRGYEEAWAYYSDNVGIRRIRLRLDGRAVAAQDFNDEGWPAGVRCDYTQRRPCGDINGGLPLQTSTVADGRHAMRLEADDAAGNVAVRESAIDVDNHAPARPDSIRVAGGEGWRARNEFELAWQNPPGQTAPIARVRYRLCRADAPGECTDGTREAEGISELRGIGVPGVGDYVLRAWLADAAGNEDPTALSDPVHLRFDDVPPGRAELAPAAGWLSAAEAASYEQRVTLASGARRPLSGIAGYSVTLDGSDPDATVDTSGDPAAFRPDRLPEGTTTVKARAVSGAGVPSEEAAAIELRVDRSPPTATLDGAPDPQQWQLHPVVVTLRGADQPGLSGMDGAPDGRPVGEGASVSYRVDDGPLQRVRGGEAEISIEADGRHVVTYQATDAAGNDSAERTSVVRIDRTPPEAAFEAAEADHPRRLRVLATDRVSGVAGGRIELRRRGDDAWRELATQFTDGRHLVALLPDERLADGVYDLRAVVRDVAGNEALAATAVNGRPAQVTLPVRRPTRIGLERPRCGARPKRRGGRTPRCGPRRSVSAPIHVRFGAPLLIRGVLVSPGDRPVRGAPIDVLSQPRAGGAVRRVASVRTDGSGRFAARVPAGPSRTIRLAYDGDETIRPSSLSIRVLVPARSVISVSPRSVRNGEAVRFAGRLLGGPVPDGGRTLELQAFFRGAWRTFATPRADAQGRWRLRYRFEATRGRVVYRFRARIPREAAYPYELGFSRTVTVAVRGR